jgi:hypothetical protein
MDVSSQWPKHSLRIDKTPAYAGCALLSIRLALMNQQKLGKLDIFSSRLICRIILLARNPEEVRMSVVIIKDDTDDCIIDMWRVVACNQSFVNSQTIFSLQQKSAFL